jgi:alpha-D-ribose 1-methylphosphonate 5-triphosphate synthase subunit PhnH
MTAPLQLATDTAYASQAAFRALMDAFARPGEIKTISGAIAPAPLAPATAALLLCLADFETPIWLEQTLNLPVITDWIRFRTGAPLVGEPGKAAFALIGNSCDLPEFTEFEIGSDEYPDRSTTLIVQVDRFAGEAIAVSGPGIQGTRTVSAEPLPRNFAARLAANRELYPRGIDLVLVAGELVQALPRSIRVVRGD